MNDETKVLHKEQQQVEKKHPQELTDAELANVSGGLRPTTRRKVRGGDDDLDELEVER